MPPAPVDKMPAVLRRALVLLSVISLMLCAASVTLGVRSVWKNDRLYAQVAGRPYVLNSEAGRLSLWRGNEAADFRAAWSTFEANWLQPWDSNAPGPVSGKWYAAGFGYVEGWYSSGFSDASKARYEMLVVPAWAVAIVTGLLPAWMFPRVWRNWRGRRRTARGKCYVCGYDVRNSPDRCTECGTPVVHEARRSA